MRKLITIDEARSLCKDWGDRGDPRFDISDVKRFYDITVSDGWDLLSIDTLEEVMKPFEWVTREAEIKALISQKKRILLRIQNNFNFDIQGGDDFDTLTQIYGCCYHDKIPHERFKELSHTCLVKIIELSERSKDLWYFQLLGGHHMTDEHRKLVNEARESVRVQLLKHTSGPASLKKMYEEVWRIEETDIEITVFESLCNTLKNMSEWDDLVRMTHMRERYAVLLFEKGVSLASDFDEYNAVMEFAVKEDMDLHDTHDFFMKVLSKISSLKEISIFYRHLNKVEPSRVESQSLDKWHEMIQTAIAEAISLKDIEDIKVYAPFNVWKYSNMKKYSCREVHNRFIDTWIGLCENKYHFHDCLEYAKTRENEEKVLEALLAMNRQEGLVRQTNLRFV